MTDDNDLQNSIPLQTLFHRIIRVLTLAVPFCLLADVSFGNDNDTSPSAHVTSIKQWEPGLVQGHGDGKFFYYNLPEFIANIDTDDKQTRYVKLKATLEAPTKADADAIDADLPLIRDSFSAYLRSLHLSDMTSPRLIKMRAELLKHVNESIAPHKINDVLFEELIIQ